MDAWLKRRQTEGKSQVIREAVMARIEAEREGEWETPDVPDEPPEWLDAEVSASA